MIVVVNGLLQLVDVDVIVGSMIGSMVAWRLQNIRAAWVWYLVVHVLAYCVSWDNTQELFVRMLLFLVRDVRMIEHGGYGGKLELVVCMCFFISLLGWRNFVELFVVCILVRNV